MTNLSDNYFIVHNFMISSLGLSGAELLVYAVIYSFSLGEKDFYPSVELISEMIGCSVCSVRRALRSLISKKLIFDHGFTCHRTRNYSVNRQAAAEAKKGGEKQKNHSEIHCDQNAHSDQNDSLTLSNCSNDPIKMIPNNKRTIKTTTTTTTKKIESETPEFHYTFLTFGNEGIVELTVLQHKRLLSLIGQETLERYITRLEGFMLTNPSAVVKSPYRTILNWIEQDTEL